MLLRPGSTLVGSQAITNEQLTTVKRDTADAHPDMEQPPAVAILACCRGPEPGPAGAPRPRHRTYLTSFSWIIARASWRRPVVPASKVVPISRASLGPKR